MRQVTDPELRAHLESERGAWSAVLESLYLHQDDARLERVRSYIAHIDAMLVGSGTPDELADDPITDESLSTAILGDAWMQAAFARGRDEGYAAACREGRDALSQMLRTVPEREVPS